MRILIPLLFFSFMSFGQIGSYSSEKPVGFRTAQSWSKEITLDKSKEYLTENIVENSSSPVRLVVDPVVAASSGELTTISYSTNAAKDVGLLFVFYGNYLNAQGVAYKGYSFKPLDKAKAIEFLNKIVSVSKENSSYLRNNSDNNNIVFTYEGMEIIMWHTSKLGVKMRVLWNGFDSEWNLIECERTLKRFNDFVE